MPKANGSGEILTIYELAIYLRVHQTTIYRLIKQGKIKSFRVGSNHRFKRTEIDRWMISESK